MSKEMRFIESICFLKGEPQLLPYHRQRMQHTAEHFGFAVPVLPNLTALCPGELRNMKLKCRLIYTDKEIEQIDFEAYIPRQVKSLQLVRAAKDFDYSYKYADRSGLDALKTKAGGADEILIVRPDDSLSDSSYANIALLQNGLWYTPECPLLAGVQRASLIDQGILQPRRICYQDLHSYEAIRLINAMLPLDSAPELSIDSIRALSI